MSGNYFDVLGVTPHTGRLLRPTDDERPGAHPVLVLDHGLWQRRFGGDPAIVGSSIDVGGRAWEVIGVTPEGFHGVDNLGFHPEVYASLMMNPRLGEDEPHTRWGWSWINVVGRMQDGVSFEETVAAMDVVSTRLREATEENDDMLAVAVPGVGLDPDGREAAGQIALMLGVIALLVLLLTCTNVANLFLSRSASRGSEVGVRLALGAARQRLARQLMTESGLLAAGATLLAVPIVAAAGDVLPLLLPTQLATSLHADGRVYAFLAGIGLLTGLLFGVAPAWSWSRRDVALTLREGASTSLRGGTRLRDGLVVVQLGLSLALVTGASLLGRSVMNARSADPGFETHGLAAAAVDLFSTGRYDEASGRAFFETLVREAESIPGMEVTLASQIPIAGGHARSSVRPTDRAADALSFEAEYTVVGPRYFETMGMPIVRGRGLGGFGEEPEPVVVVNEALAMLFWPGDDAVGKTLWTNRGESRVVGIVPDVQMRSLRSRGNPAVYHPIDQSYLPSLLLHMRGTDGQLPTSDVLRGAVSAVDSEIPVSRVYDVEAAMVASMSETRTIGYLVGVFAILALLLAAVGLYGLVAFAASQRIREFGIRIALGARPEEVTRLVLGRGLTVATVGIGFGLVVSYGLGSALQSLLFGIAPADPVTFSGAAMVLLLAATLAAWLPARRAGRLDAAISLRE